MNLYISNLSPETTEQDLEKAFSEFGAIKSLKIIMDRETNISKGYGFVEMEDKGAGFDAIDYLDMSYLRGNIVNVREAKNTKDGAPSYAKKRSFQPRTDGSRPRQNNFNRRDNYNREGGYNRENNYNNNYKREGNYNRESNDNYGRKYNSDKDYNNDLSYNA